MIDMPDRRWLSQIQKYIQTQLNWRFRLNSRVDLKSDGTNGMERIHSSVKMPQLITII